MAEKTARNNRKRVWAQKLLKWYDINRRTLPWRARAGAVANPYHVWLSEIMLQQTTVAAVIPYFLRFIRRWPSVKALAKARIEDVLQEWAGLGYYRRAHNLHKTAQAVICDYNGLFPSDLAALKMLPGVGDYTAAAIRSIAFDGRANVVDGNVERVIARVFGVMTPFPKAKVNIKKLADQCVPDSRFGDYAQALMDLGAMVCTPRSPNCAACPLKVHCVALAKRKTDTIPFQTKGSKRPSKRALAFVAFDNKDRVLLEKRPPKGLFPDMIGVPMSPIEPAETFRVQKALSSAPFSTGWTIIGDTVHHVFTHFGLDVMIAVRFGKRVERGSGWVETELVFGQALPTLMKKILMTALKCKRG